MTRDILFRGRTIADNPKWVFGDLIQSESGENTFIRERNDKAAIGEGVYIVDPATIGQFTGLKDKEGNKIFEGDTLQDHEFVERVRYVPHKAMFMRFNQHGWAGPMKQKLGKVISSQEVSK